MDEIIRIGNYDRDSDSPTDYNVYLGSGDCGGLFDCYGLQGAVGVSDSSPVGILHGDYYLHGRFNMDFFAKPFFLRYLGLDPSSVKAKQHLDIFDGALTTRLSGKSFDLTTVVSFDPYRRDVILLELSWSGSSLPAVAVSPMGEYDFSYQQTMPRSVFTVLSSEQSRVVCNVTTGNACGLLFVTAGGSARLAYDAENGIVMQCEGESGSASLRVVFGSPLRAGELAEEDVPLTSADTASSWHRRWGKSRISFSGNDDILRLFWRGMYHLLCSHGASARFISPPMGWCGTVSWTFHFPQDFEYVVPALLKMGHLDIVKAKVELYASHIPSQKLMTKRFYGAEGTMWSWEFPVSRGADMFPGNVTPNPYQFEIHNAAFPAKLAYDCHTYARDRAWSEKYAWEVIYASAQFYGSILRKEGKTWGIALTPSMSQDEFAPANGKNYLCALYSARYTLGTALRFAEELGKEIPEKEAWQTILSDGLAFDRLVNQKTGVYKTFECPDEEYPSFSEMKHPVPLSPVSFFPVGELNGIERRAYERRMDLCRDSHDHTFYGWTLVDILLAAAHMGDRKGFWQAMDEMRPSVYTDEDWRFLFETSRVYRTHHYVTSEGLFCDAVLCGIYNDFFGKEEINVAGFRSLSVGAFCLPEGKSFSRSAE